MKKILLVDDEQPILTLLEYHLVKEGYKIITAMDGKQAVQLAEEQSPDLIILDIMLPSMDGFEVCHLLRQKRNFTPILVLTAKTDELDKVLGLEIGADDYMTKPFSPREVVAKVRAILRRVTSWENIMAEKQKAAEKLSIGNLEIFLDKQESYIGGELIELTPKEFELLVYLANNKGRILSREQLLESIWRLEFSKDTRVVDVHISHLRGKLESNAERPLYIKTVRGRGYKLEEMS